MEADQIISAIESPLLAAIVWAAIRGFNVAKQGVGVVRELLAEVKALRKEMGELGKAIDKLQGVPARVEPALTPVESLNERRDA